METDTTVSATNILEFDWEVWFERNHQSLFFISVFNRFEGPQMRSLIGAGFYGQVGLQRGETVTYIRSHAEFDSLRESVCHYIDSASEENVKALFSKCAAYPAALDALLVELEGMDSAAVLKNLDHLIENCVTIVGCTTSIPYMFVDALGAVTEESPRRVNVRAESEKMRGGKSLYPLVRDHIFERIFAAVQESIPVSSVLVRRMTVEEVRESILAGKLTVSEDVLVAREKCVHWFDEAQDKTIVSTNAGLLEALERKVLPDHSDITTLQGVVAFRGSAVGTVRIVRSLQDVDKVQEGDIIISHSTNPELLPALIRCGAIVTDEGGVASHAAIIARELQKPCVIATRIATKVFKDGDMVKVDADQGMVRKV